MESARLVIALTRLVHDVGLAEDLAQEAFAAALAQWPGEGVPDKPGAWLMTTARHKAVDLIRRERSRDEKYAQLTTDPTLSEPRDSTDDMLALMFIASHPVLSDRQDTQALMSQDLVEQRLC